MRRMFPRTDFLLVGTLIIATHGVAYGEGFRLPYQGTAAAGQAEAFIAQADDASAMYYNSAGMTQLDGVQLYGGAHFITGQFFYTSPAGDKFEGNFRQPGAMPPPGHLYLTGNLEDLGGTALGPLTVGIGVNTPFGLGIQWPNDVPFSSVVTEATLPLLDVKPTVAYKIHDMLSIGAGADIYTFAGFIGEGQAELHNNIPGVASLEINGTDTTAGFNVSGLITPLRNDIGKPLINFGLGYRSAATLDLKGDLLVTDQKVSDAVTTIPFPG
jgi:long-chain fatty acid transport protein